MGKKRDGSMIFQSLCNYRSKEQVERRKKGGEDIFERDARSPVKGSLLQHWKQQTEGEEQQTTSIRLTWSPPTWVKFLQEEEKDMMHMMFVLL